MLARRQNFDFRGNRVAQAALVLLRQEFHREMNSLQFAPRDSKVARMLRPACKNNGIKFGPQIFNRNIFSNLCAGNKLHTLGRHLLEPPINDVLFQLELWNTVAQQSTDAIRFLIHSHRMPGTAQLLRRSQPRWPGTYNRDFLSRTHFRRLRLDPAFVKSALDNALLVLLDRHRRLIDATHARLFARSRANAAGELWKIIRGM